jgi:hypothetical protein
MKTPLTIPGLTAAILLFPASHAFAQTTGTSHPEQLNDPIVATDSASAQSSSPHYAKPSPDVPYTAAPTAVTPVVTPGVSDPDAQIVTTPAPAATVAPQQPAPIVSSTPATQTAILNHAPVIDDPDARIVTSVPEIPGGMNLGTLLHAELQTPLSTTRTHVGDTFLASTTQPVTQHGVVLLPAGSQIRGRISYVHGGRRIGGPAAIRLQPDFITLPDGTVHRLYAEVINLDNFNDAHVNSEGTIVNSSHPKATLAALGLTTGAAATAGAVVGGGVGAAVGAGIGAGVGTIWWLKRDVQQELPSGTGLVFSLDQPLVLTQTTR